MESTNRNYTRKIVELKLFDMNPRYTDFVDIDWEKIQQYGNEKTEDEIAIKLLSYEEDFTNFLTLLESLKSGFDQGQDQIICVETVKGDFIVVEGNRRTLAVKMLLNPNWAIDIIENFSGVTKFKKESEISYISDFDDLHEEDMEKNSEEAITAIQKVKRKIINLSKNDEIKIDKDERVSINLYNKDSDFTNLEIIRSINHSIFGRSVAAPGGKMRWPRFQSLKNAWDIYLKKFNPSNENVGEAVEYTASVLNRSPNSVKMDIVAAKWILFLKENYNNKKHNLGDWKKVRTSALELCLSTIKIDDISENLEHKTISDFLELKNTDIKTVELDIESNIKSSEEIASFLVDSYFDDLFTTRGWKLNKSRRTLIKFINSNKQMTTFLELSELGDEQKNIVNDIEKIAKLMNDVIFEVESQFEDDELVASKSENSAQSILKKFMIRLLKNDVKRLLRNFPEQDVYTYPYLTIVSSARTCVDLLEVYAFGLVEDLRNEVIKIEEEREKPNNKFIKLYKDRTSQQINESLYKKDWKTSNITQNINYKLSGNNYKELREYLDNSQYFFDKKLAYDKIFEIYRATLFNRTVHAPYWLINSNNIVTIKEIMLKSLLIIYNFAIILNIKNIETVDIAIETLQEN